MHEMKHPRISQLMLYSRAFIYNCPGRESVFYVEKMKKQQIICLLNAPVPNRFG